MTTTQREKNILPEGHEDPMLMTIEQLQRAVKKAKKTGTKWAPFLEGVLFARASSLCAGIPPAK